MLLSSLLTLTVLGQGPESDTPGFSYLGSGYDLLEGNPLSTTGYGDPGFRLNIFDWTYNEGRTTYDKRYRIADKTRSRTFSACSTNMQEQIYNTAYSYQRIIDSSFDIDLHLGKPGEASVDFSFGIEVRNTRNHTDNRAEIYAHVSAICTKYQLEMNIFDQAPVTRDFERAIELMPLEFNMRPYARLLDVYGTHYINSMKTGGRWGMQMTFKTKDFTALIEDHVDVNAGIRFVAGAANGGVRINSTDDRRTTYAVNSRISKNSTFSIGGDYSPDPKEWMRSVEAKPLPIHLSLMRLDSLVNTWVFPKIKYSDLQRKKQNLVRAINEYCAFQQSRNPGFSCKPQKPIPLPTPSPISQDAVRRVCVENQGGYALYWRITSGRRTGAQSDTYSAGFQRCIDGSQINARRGDKLSCRAKAIAGREVDCNRDIEFNPRSSLQANYKCEGSALSIHCFFNGISVIGGQGIGRRLQQKAERLSLN